jgi:hypothetical protein
MFSDVKTIKAELRVVMLMLWISLLLHLIEIARLFG